MIWIPEERKHIRIEDMPLVTEASVENMSAFVLSEIADVEGAINEGGLNQFRPPTELPLKK
jgi:hypothetical protein